MKKGMVVMALCMTAATVGAQDFDAASYATCSACHLPDGAGIPAAFPPIRDRAAKIAALAGGREYLVTVVSYGLMGTIDVAGTKYFGVMAGNMGALDEADIAAALNYAVFELGDGDGLAPFTADEVRAVQAGVALQSPAGGGQLREKLVAEHGEQWP